MAEELTEDALYAMSDEDLEAAFQEASAEEAVEEEVVEEETAEPEVEEEEAELEQPDEEQDSDDDASSDDESEDEEEEDAEETEEGELDEEPEAEEDEPTEDEEEDEKEEQPVQKHAFKANGREYEFTEQEVREQFPKIFGQAMDYTKKMQAIKPWRKSIDALEQAELGHDDVNLMIDVLKGDKDAIAEVMKRTGVDADTLTLDTEDSKYVAKDYGRDDTALAIKDVVDEISTDTEYDTTHDILSKQWDDRSWKEMSSRPELIKLLHVDVKSGMYDKVQPIAEKMKVFDRGSKSDLEYYKEAAGVYFQEQAQEDTRNKAAEEKQAKAQAKAAQKTRVKKVEQEAVKRKEVKKASTKRKAAAPTKKVAGTQKAVDYLDDSDEGFDEWYKQLQDRS